MKKQLLTLLLFVLLVSNAMAAFTERSEPYLVKHYKLKSGSSLSVTTNSGNIQVIGTDAKTASVAVLVTDLEGNYNKAFIEKALKNYKIDIREEKNTIIANVARNLELSENASELIISLRINIPKKSTCNLNSTQGSISLNNVKGNTNIISVGGNISLWEFAGELKAESNGGAISLNDAEGILELSSSGGCIDLKKVAGDIMARSEGGSISADVRELGKYLTLETNEGSLKAIIPGTQGLNVDVSGAQVKTDIIDFKGISEKARVLGHISGGGIPIKLHSTRGVAQLISRS